MSDDIPQGDLRLLETEQARTLLASTIPARVAYLGADGTPRVVPTWFQWTGTELVMPTFIKAPHVHRPAQRLRAMQANPAVAVTIDTESFPPQILQLRGRVEITEHDGIVDEYAVSARRYLGDEEATAYLMEVDQPGTRMARIAVRPTWVGLVDFATRPPEVMAGT